MTVIGSVDEFRAAINEVAARAQRLISIYTPDLNGDLYDQDEFLEIVKRFVLAKNYAKVRVVVIQGAQILRISNRFVALSRRLASYIEMRPLETTVPYPRSEFIIGDDRAIALRPRIESWEGVADFDNPPNARPHLERFDELWVASDREQMRLVATR